ncbi:MAG: LytTR family DNA-binding domain-containing protein [Ignavibacteria bacterium]|nr:LytTR family DNA-binding domain-containing protein [Ignavibacteria bacterium]
MKRAVIIDDEKLSRENIAYHLGKFRDIELVGEAENGFDGFKLCQEERPDLVFLDIQMPKLTGFEMLELFETPPEVIFITAFDQFALQAFSVNAIDYLLKPFSEERFSEAIERFFKRTSTATEQELTRLQEYVQDTRKNLSRIVIKDANRAIVVPMNEVQYIEAQDDYVAIYASKKYLKKITLKTLESQLDENEFIRIHRSYIINISALKEIKTEGKEIYSALLKNGISLPVSKNGIDKLRSVLR